MRWVVLGAAAATVAVLGAGCTQATPTPAPTEAPARTSSAPRDPRLVQACVDARAVINSSTAHVTVLLADAVGAGERGDTAGRDLAITNIRTQFGEWAAKLRELAERIDNAELKTVVVEYAGAVDAAIARVSGPADLDKLSTFDDEELDTVASRLADVCP